jgi:hypothetical protein
MAVRGTVVLAFILVGGLTACQSSGTSAKAGVSLTEADRSLSLVKVIATAEAPLAASVEPVSLVPLNAKPLRGDRVISDGKGGSASPLPACEQAHQQLKEELGLDHFEGRSWRAAYTATPS